MKNNIGCPYLQAGKEIMTKVIPFIKNSLSIIICLIFMINSTSLFAQNDPPSDSYVNFNGNAGIVHVTLPDSGIQEIEVAISSKGIDLFANSYQFDVTTGLQPGLTYSRNGLDVSLGIGTLTVPSAFNTRVRLKNLAGTWSGWLEYTSN